MGMVTGTAGDDELIGTSGDDVIDGLGGNDILRGGAGSDRLLGGTGHDRLFGDDGDDLLSDNDSGSDLLDGGEGNDRLYLYRLDSRLNETVTLIGGAGNDSISSWSYASGSVTVDAGSGDDEVLLWSPTNSHRLTLGTGRDVLDLNRFQTWSMDTTVREVTDFAPGILGDTIILFDLLSSYGTWDGQVNPFTHDILQLEQRGSDTVLLIRLDDGTALSHDLLILRGVPSDSLVAENFGGFSPNGVAAASMTLSGGPGPDTLAGGYGDDQISGGDGSDTLHGSAGNDRIEGGEGSDYITGGYGNDVVSAGAGADFIELVHDGGSDVVDAGSGNDRISVYRNYRDVFERLTITAGGGDDVVTFQLFDRGGTSVDLGEGNDRFTLLGTAHDLCITLGPGSDTLDLADHYVSTIGQEHVSLLDYTPGEDRILWGNWLKQELVGWDWHTDPFAGGFLRLSEQVGQLVLMVDRDGPGTDYQEAPFLSFRGLASGALSDADFLLFSPRPENDFNGDGRSDVLLRHSSGLLTNWLGEAGGTFSSNHQSALYSVPPEWRIAATGDFNGDGRSDILFRNDNGGITQWLGQGAGQFRWNAAASYPVDPSWSIAAAGDFNGDGRHDVVLRNVNGLLTEWLGKADGTFFSNDAIATYHIPVSWKVAGAGDFNGDGRSDLLLRNTDGTVTQWLARADGTFLWNAPATYALDPAWSVAGIGDFDGDGRDDLVLHKAETGQVVNWLGEYSGTFFSNHLATNYTLGAGWGIANVGDYNGDGRADLLLRNSDGLITEWLGQAGATFTWNEAAIYALATDWVS